MLLSNILGFKSNFNQFKGKKKKKRRCNYEADSSSDKVLNEIFRDNVDIQGQIQTLLHRGN